jgi:hypothetical protein
MIVDSDVLIVVVGAGVARSLLVRAVNPDEEVLSIFLKIRVS